MRFVSESQRSSGRRHSKNTSYPWSCSVSQVNILDVLRAEPPHANERLSLLETFRSGRNRHSQGARDTDHPRLEEIVGKVENLGTRAVVFGVPLSPEHLDQRR